MHHNSSSPDVAMFEKHRLLYCEQEAHMDTGQYTSVVFLMLCAAPDQKEANQAALY